MLGTMAQRTAHDSPAANRFARSGTVLLLGTLASNVLSYAFFVVLSRRLDQADLGAVGSLVNVSVIAGIPALGLQLVTARLVAHRAHDPQRARDLEIRLLKAALWFGVATAAALSLLSPLLAPALDVPVLASVVVALCMVPLTVLLSTQGLLQGRERFIALAVVLALGGVGKVTAALLAHQIGQGPTAVVGLYGITLVLVAGVGVAQVLFSQRASWSRRTTGAGSPTAPSGGTARLLRLVAAAVVPTSGLLFLAGIDVLLARHHLAPAESGQYTIGALFEKAAFWGMAFLATLFYPAMADEERRRSALIRALSVTAGLGVLGTAGTAALGDHLARLVGGPSFEPLGADLWRFAAFGVALALVQVLAYAGIAAATVRMGIAMWVVSGAAVLSVALVADSVTDIVTILLVCAAGLVAAGLYIERETLLRPRPASGLSEPRRARSVRRRR